MRAIIPRANGTTVLVRDQQRFLATLCALATGLVIGSLGVVFHFVDGSGTPYWVLAAIAIAIAFRLMIKVRPILINPARKTIAFGPGAEGPERFFAVRRHEIETRVSRRGSALRTVPGPPLFHVTLVAGDTLTTANSIRRYFVARPDDDRPLRDKLAFELAKERSLLGGGLLEVSVIMTAVEQESRDAAALVATTLDLPVIDLTSAEASDRAAR